MLQVDFFRLFHFRGSSLYCSFVDFHLQVFVHGDVAVKMVLQTTLFQSRNAATEWTGSISFFLWPASPIFWPTLICRCFKQFSKAQILQLHSVNLFSSVLVRLVRPLKLVPQSFPLQSCTQIDSGDAFCGKVVIEKLPQITFPYYLDASSGLFQSNIFSQPVRFDCQHLVACLFFLNISRHADFASNDVASCIVLPQIKVSLHDRRHKPLIFVLDYFSILIKCIHSHPAHALPIPGVRITAQVCPKCIVE